MSNKMCTFPVLVIDCPNLNNRVYTKKVAQSIVEQFRNLKTPLYGELLIYDDGTKMDTSFVSLKNATHIVKRLDYNFSASYDRDLNYLEGKKTIIKAEIEFLDNEIADMAYNMRDSLSLSLRGYGKLEPNCYRDPKTDQLEGECLGIKVDDFTLESIDLILTKDSSFRDVF